MHTWVLILTVAMYGYGNSSQGSGVSVQSVDGFTSVNACLAAGNEWLRATKTIDPPYTNLRARAICVQK